MTQRRLWHPSRWSVRARATAVTTIVVAAALVTGAFILVLVVRGQLTASAEQAALVRAEDIEGLLSGGTDLTSIAVGDEDDALVQVIDADNRVVVASGNIAGEGPLVGAGEPVAPVRRVPVGEHPFVIVTEQLRAQGEQFTVVSGQSLESTIQITRILGGALAAGVPVLVVLVLALTWRMTGTALAPVEQIRRRVAEVQGADPSLRVPVPDTRDEVARLALTMNDMLERIQTFQQRQRQFVSDASHELRSPIAGVRQLTEVAIKHPENNDEQMVADVHAEAIRMQRLVDDLLLLAKGQTSSSSRPGQTVDLDDLALAEIDRLRMTPDVIVDGSGISTARTTGNEDHLRRLVRNLVDNAVNHTRQRIAISTLTDDGAVLIVDDDGPGIPTEDRARAFERFVRLDAARSRDEGGSGLGLAIAQEIAEQNGGTVTITDSPWGGARLVLRLPESN